MAIGVDKIMLSMTEHEQWSGRSTGKYLTANVYTVDGVYDDDGELRRLSIGQLVMALCLQRAAELESQVVGKMASIENTSTQLELMTEIETNVLAGSVNMSSRRVTYNGTSYTYFQFLTEVMGMDVDSVPTGTVNADSTDFLTALESKMDEKNTFSQQTMIELQSLTNKRDQSYDMVSNVLKSVNTVLVGNANNM